MTNPTDIQTYPSESRGWVRHRNLQPVLGAKNAGDIDRLGRDEDLILHLGLLSYRGPKFERFRGDLASYAWPVIRSWCVTGKIFEECRAVGYSVRPPRRALSRDDADDLAKQTVAHALVYFREKVLLGRRWNPREGASLATFFVGACKRSFPNVYRRWFKELHEREIAAEPLDESVCGDRTAKPDGALRMRQALAAFGSENVALVTLAALGESHEELAAHFSATPKAIERRLYKARAHWRATYG